MQKIILALIVVFSVQCVTSTAAEPAVCLDLVPLDDDQVDLVGWLIENSRTLKKEGCWQSHITLSKKGMEEADKQRRYREKTEIALQVSSSYFYLGDYKTSRILAEEAGSYAQKHEFRKETIESLYLRSGIARAEGRKEAVDLARQALTQLETHRPDDRYLRAKIYYNLGAAYSDGAEPNLSKARETLLKSNELYHTLNNHYEIVRSGLRLARVDYLKKDYIKALATIQSVEVYLETPRSSMLYHFAMAKILSRLKKWRQAKTEVLQALSLAGSLGASVDQKRAEQLLHAIEQKTTIED
jgi:tetratricopeptide (TPR) repeat protein